MDAAAAKDDGNLLVEGDIKAKNDGGTIDATTTTSSSVAVAVENPNRNLQDPSHQDADGENDDVKNHHHEHHEHHHKHHEHEHHQHGEEKEGDTNAKEEQEEELITMKVKETLDDIDKAALGRTSDSTPPVLGAAEEKEKEADIKLNEEETKWKEEALDNLEKLDQVAEKTIQHLGEKAKKAPNQSLSSAHQRLETTVLALQEKSRIVTKLIREASNARWRTLCNLTPTSPIPILRDALELAKQAVNNAQKRPLFKRKDEHNEHDMELNYTNEFELKLRIICFQFTFLEEIMSVHFVQSDIQGIYDLENNTEVFKKINVGDLNTIRKRIQFIGDMFSKANATFINAGEYKNTVSQSIMVLGGFVYYGSSVHAAKNKFTSSQMTVDQQALKKLWNLPDTSSTVRLWTKMTLPSITVNRKIKIPITINPPVQPEPEPQTRSRSFSMPSLFSGQNHTNDTAASTTTITARILCSRILPLTSDKKLDLSGKNVTLIIHYHGGGFIAMSSFSHQDYTRKWCKYLHSEIPYAILSVDYRLAPECPYPIPVDDCFDAYKWAVENSHTILGVPADKFIVTGDSAGGNLSAVIALKAIDAGIRVPDGVILSYPVLNMCRDAPLPARVLSYKDPILAYAFLDKVLKCYLPETAQPRTDPWLSPVYASDELLSKYPPTYILTGNNDPLYHDSYQFTLRLMEHKRFVRLYVYDGFCHGYLSFANKPGISFPEAHRTMKDVTTCILKLVRGELTDALFDEPKKKKGFFG